MSQWRNGGCHCGAVRFRVRTGSGRLLDCNCSICRKKGYLHLIVRRADFEQMRGEDALRCYQFNTKTAKHFFCETCGVSPFYIPRSHPDGVDVNARCLDDLDLSEFRIEPFDGQEWERRIASIEGYDD